MNEDESTTPWTVGRLRTALAAYDADTPLRVAVPDDDEPGAVEDRYGVVDLGFGRSKQDAGSDWVQDDFLTLEVAFSRDQD